MFFDRETECFLTERQRDRMFFDRETKRHINENKGCFINGKSVGYRRLDKRNS